MKTTPAYPPPQQRNHSDPVLEKTKPSRFPVLLQWAAEDLADTTTPSDSPLREKERQEVAARLTPYIEELVHLALAQLQQTSGGGVTAMPDAVCDYCHGTGVGRRCYSTEYGPCTACEASPNSTTSASVVGTVGGPAL